MSGLVGMSADGPYRTNKATAAMSACGSRASAERSSAWTRRMSADDPERALGVIILMALVRSGSLSRLRARARLMRRASGLEIAPCRFFCVRANSNLSNRINLICPVQSFAEKYFPSRLPRNTSMIPRVPPLQEGRFAIVTDVGCGMRWTRACRKTNGTFRGRRSRVVLTPRRWRQVGDDASLASRPATVTTRPDHREEREGNR